MAGLNDKQFQMRVDDEFLERVDLWRNSQPDMPGRAEAIRRLVLIGTEVSRIIDQTSPVEVRGISDAVAKNRTLGLDLLTPREREILDLVARGSRNKTIASELSLSEHTVKVHVHNIMSKLNAANRAQVASMVVHSGDPSSAPTISNSRG